MKNPEIVAPPALAADCGAARCGSCSSTNEVVAAPGAPAGEGVAVFRISTMDCAAEESEIRRALQPIVGIKGLRFQLGARTLTITAAPEVLPSALDAIRRVGFDPKPATTSDGSAASRQGASEAHDHEHGDELSHEHADLGSGIARLILALALAIGAESLSFFAPDTLVFKGAGMALALAAIGLAGLDTYKKGLGALRQGRLNINALMAVAVTGAFVIGQWPEAAMVMALYAIAELIEARSVDRARNAIQSLFVGAREG